MAVMVEFPIEEAEAMLRARDLLDALGFPGSSACIRGFDRLEQARKVERSSGGSEQSPGPNIMIFGGATFEVGKPS